MSEHPADDLQRKLTAVYEKLTEAYAKIALLEAELMRAKAALRRDLPYDAMGGYEL